MPSFTSTVKPVSFEGGKFVPRFRTLITAYRLSAMVLLHSINMKTL